MKRLFLVLLLIVALGRLFFSGRAFAPAQGRWNRHLNLPSNLERWRECLHNDERSNLAEFDSLMRTQPIEILELIVQRRIVLRAPLQNWLAYEALENLAAQLEAEPDYHRAVGRIERAQGLARKLQSTTLNNLLLSLHNIFQSDRQRRGLRLVAEAMDAEQYEQARSLAKQWVDLSGLASKLRSPLENTVAAINLDNALTDLRAALQAQHDSKSSAEDKLQAWLRLEPAHLPAPLRRTAATVRGFTVLLDATSRPWEKAPDVAILRRALAEYRGGTGDGLLAGQVQQILAIKALLQGYPKAALDLLPETGQPEHAALLMRDLQTLLHGSGGTLTTLPPSCCPLAETPTTPPPGLLHLLSHASQSRWQPPTLSPSQDADRLRSVGQHQLATWLATLEKNRQPLVDQGKKQLVAARDLLGAAVAQSRVDDNENQQWLRKLGAEGISRLGLLEKALALEYKREKASLTDTVGELEHVPDFLNLNK